MAEDEAFHLSMATSMPSLHDQMVLKAEAIRRGIPYLTGSMIMHHFGINTKGWFIRDLSFFPFWNVGGGGVGREGCVFFLQLW
ncbi:hypothetical protein [Telmatospirillum siberiense]|uniref:hypothetical protein n=1 Tax=Telmatospirillum siberiense TaxID=382514 RepID=UPI0018EDA7F0|nr:hypothetical protein [Telmatospirillum siberiense]